MAAVTMDDISGNAYKCRVTLMAPSGKGHILDRYLATLTDWVDPSRQIVDVDEKLPGEELYNSGPTVPSVHGCLLAPALNVMLFMRESGTMSVEDIHKTLKKPPWQFHHKVELQNKHAPNTAVAKQEFYKLEEDLPLFAACPVLTESEHLRVQFYVHNFPAMVEFYRTITETEIETSKPDFCIFELYRQSGLAIQLSLKRSQYIYPVPVKSAYISFNVKNIKTIQLTTNANIENIGGNVYTTYDPDGNLVVLYENDQIRQDAFSDLADTVYKEHNIATSSRCRKCDKTDIMSSSFDEGRSMKSTSESHDSGQVSDLDGVQWDSGIIPDEFVTMVKPKRRDKCKNTRDKSEGYASSDISSDITLVSDSMRAKVTRMTSHVSDIKNFDCRGNGSTNGSPRGESRNERGSICTVTPVYI